MTDGSVSPRRLSRLAIASAAVAALVIPVLGVATVAYAIVGDPFDPFDNRSFSPNSWKSADHTARARMARDARRTVVVGWSETQVKAFFGQPDSIITDAEDAGGHLLAGVQTWQWYLGSWSTYGFDDAFFYVSFDHAGHVVQAEVSGY